MIQFQPSPDGLREKRRPLFFAALPGYFFSLDLQRVPESSGHSTTDQTRISPSDEVSSLTERLSSGSPSGWRADPDPGATPRFGGSTPRVKSRRPN